MKLKDITEKDISRMLEKGDDYTSVGVFADLLREILNYNLQIQGNQLALDDATEFILDIEVSL